MIEALMVVGCASVLIGGVVGIVVFISVSVLIAAALKTEEPKPERPKPDTPEEFGLDLDPVRRLRRIWK